MATSKVPTVESYLKSLPADRRAALAKVRETILANLPKGYEEGIQYGMISYMVPASVVPETYNGEQLAIASLAAQKNYMSLYLLGCYGDPKVEKWFVDAYKKSGKKLDMGKSCVRFKTLGDLPLDVIGQAITKVPMDAFVAHVRKVYAGKKLKPIKKKT